MKTKLSSKNQMVLPKALRETLGVSAGDNLILVPRGNVVVLMHKPASYAEALYGIMKPRGEKSKVSARARKLARDRTKW